MTRWTCTGFLVGGLLPLVLVYFNQIDGMLVFGTPLLAFVGMAIGGICSFVYGFVAGIVEAKKK